MSTNKHTPGPWRWWTSNSWKRLKHDDRGVTTNVLEPHAYKDGFADCDVSNADMALIAAAPDLLAVLQWLFSAQEAALHAHAHIHGADKTMTALQGQITPLMAAAGASVLAQNRLGRDSETVAKIFAAMTLAAGEKL